jgi:competence protein ComEC
MRAHLIDVGQGAATLFEFSCGVVLVDTGGESNASFDSHTALARYLDAFFEARPELHRTIALLVITHPHKDHVASADVVTTQYAVENVVTSGLIKKESGSYYSGGRKQQALQQWADEHAKLETIDAAAIDPGGRTSAIVDPIACADADPRLSVLWGRVAPRPAGWGKGAFDEANNHSVTLRVELGAASFLVTGDLELEGIAELLAKHAGTSALDVDVWQVSHHGAANGANAALLAAISPQIALLGTGAPERELPFTAWAYGHPRKEVIDLLIAQMARKRSPTTVQVGTGAKTFEPLSLRRAIYATGWDGHIVVSATSAGDYVTRTRQ